MCRARHWWLWKKLGIGHFPHILATCRLQSWRSVLCSWKYRMQRSCHFQQCWAPTCRLLSRRQHGSSTSPRNKSPKPQCCEQHHYSFATSEETFFSASLLVSFCCCTIGVWIQSWCPPSINKIWFSPNEISQSPKSAVCLYWEKQEDLHALTASSVRQEWDRLTPDLSAQDDHHPVLFDRHSLLVDPWGSLMGICHSVVQGRLPRSLGMKRQECYENLRNERGKATSHPESR